MVRTPFDSLMARAGAPDTDRERWLSERLEGITATEAKNLMLHPEDMEHFVIQKVMSTPLPDNRYMSWGRFREPVIAQVVTGQLPAMTLEHRVFHAEGNKRHLASPDMVADMGSYLEGCEIKTCSRSLAEDSEAYKASGYYYQMQWQAYVCNFERVLFAYEQHNNEWSGGNNWAGHISDFETPGAVHDVQGFWVGRNEAVIATMIERANEFLALYDDMRGV